MLITMALGHTNAAGAQPLLTLLVIDDDPLVLELAGEALSQEGLRIVSANTPEHGLELFFKDRPQIVITDLMMPGMTGMQVLETIVAADPAVDVILLTGH